uniref:Proteasome alpha-type subunits domain-containing protein n=1 Tax=Bos mutus grunniens TaxID=30521 RepID=A0A8B9X071_BOSMU
MSYNRSITVFSPSGHLFPVEYLQEAMKKGWTMVSVRGKDIVVLGVEKSVAKLQDERTVRKVCALDDNVFTNRARVECQSHRLTVEDLVTMEYITRYIASLKQRYTQSKERWGFGISALLVGFDFDGTPDSIRLTSQVLLEMVQSGGKNIELAVVRQDQPLKILNPEEIEKYIAEIGGKKKKKKMKRRNKRKHHDEIKFCL